MAGKGSEETLDLDQIMEDGRPSFTGEQEEETESPLIVPAPERMRPPVEVKEETSEDLEEKPTPDETHKPEEKPEAAKETTPSEKPKTEETPAEEKTKAEETATKEDEAKKDYLFKDQDAAEEGYKRLQADASNQGRRIRELEAIVEQNKGDKDFQEKVAESQEAYRAKMKELKLRTVKMVEDLDEEAPDYNDRVSEIMADEESDRVAWLRDHPELYGTREAPATTTEREAETTSTGAQEPTTVEEARQMRDRISLNQGWSLEDPEHGIFLHFCNQTPADTEDPFSKQLETAMTKTKAFLEQRSGNGGSPEETGSTEETPTETEEKPKVGAAAAQELPLGPGGETPAGRTPTESKKSEDEKQLSINQALENVFDENRL